MAQLTIKGKVTEVLPQRSGTGKNGNEWRSKQYVIEEPGQYTNSVCFEVKNDNIYSFGIKVGQEIEAKCYIQANKWNEKWFNSIVCKEVNIIGMQENVTRDNANKQKESITTESKSEDAIEDDNLPF